MNLGIYEHEWCFESSRIALAHGSFNFENFLNITCALKSRNALAFIRFPLLVIIMRRRATTTVSVGSVGTVGTVGAAREPISGVELASQSWEASAYPLRRD